LGERALQELKDDNLIKFNYFLTDIRGRNVRSYMRMPIPSLNDPGRTHFLNALAKHDINADEYHSIYEKSSIPSSNSLSAFSLQIFESNSSLVPQYNKYRDQLHSVIQKHMESGNIQAAADGNLIVTNQGAFSHGFDEIMNLMSTGRQEKLDRRSQPLQLLQETTNVPLCKSTIEVKKLATTNTLLSYNSTSKENHPNQYRAEDLSADEQDIEPLAIYLSSSCVANQLLKVYL
jgi:hypothetical protein